MIEQLDGKKVQQNQREFLHRFQAHKKRSVQVLWTISSMPD